MQGIYNGQTNEDKKTPASGFGYGNEKESKGILFKTQDADNR